MKRFVQRSLAVASSLMLLTSCQSALREGSFASVSDIIAGVTDASGTYTATLVTGTAPTAGAGPTVTVNGIGVLINGGSTNPKVDGSAAFTRVIVTIDGMKDYYELTLPAGVSTQDLIITAKPDAVASSLFFMYAVGDGTSIGPYAHQQMRFVPVGRGDVQISVAWSDTSDVDLHVVDPAGEEIYFGHINSVSGGFLDLDSNAACSRQNVTATSPGVHNSNENVVWPTGGAPSGTYKVVLDYWSPCGNAQTDWVVTIQRVGAAPQTFTGSFVGAGAPMDTVSVFTY